MLNFDMVEFEEVEDEDFDNWEDEYTPYKPDGVVVKTESTDSFEGLKLLLEKKSTFKLLRQVHAIFLHMDQILEPYGEIPHDPLTISPKYDLENRNISNYLIPFSKDHLFSSQIPKNNSLMVQSHLFEFEFTDYLEILVNFYLGFFDQTISIKTVAFTNCTVQSFEMIVFYQQMDVHVKEERWVPAIDESANFLEQADPIAKACVPAF